MSFSDWAAETMNRFESHSPQLAARKSIDELYKGVKRRVTYFSDELYFRPRIWYGGQYRTITVNEMRMTVNLRDEGISRDLYRRRIREPHATKQYLTELRRLEDQTEVTVLDVGANIGYYALQPLSVLGDACRVLAVEPGPDNIDLLTENVEQNGAQEQIVVEQAAVGAENRSGELALSKHSNRHTVPSELSVTRHRDTIQMDIRRSDDLVTEMGTTPAEIDVVRMDIEGFENEALKGMEEILSTGVSLINMELHAGGLPSEELESICATLNETGLQVVSASRGKQKLDAALVDSAIRDYDVEQLQAFGSPELVMAQQ